MAFIIWIRTNNQLHCGLNDQKEQFIATQLWICQQKSLDMGIRASVELGKHTGMCYIRPQIFPVKKSSRPIVSYTCSYDEQVQTKASFPVSWQVLF